MKIQYTTKEPRLDKNNKPTSIETVDLGAKVLPINLGDAMNKALSFCDSDFVTSSVYISKNNNIEKNNNIKSGNIYTKCHKNTITIEELKKKAQGNLIDLHFFPIKYKGDDKKSEESYVDYNLRKALIVMIEMEKSMEWLVGYNEASFIIEYKDIKKTLNTVAHRLTNDSLIIQKVVENVMDVYTNLDVEYIKSKYNDFWWNVDFFIGTNRFIKNITNYETYDKNQYIGVYVYGDKREDAWRNVTHKLDNSLCLFMDNTTKMMLKRVKNTMTGQQFHKYLNDLIGKWFDLSGSNWTNIRQNMKRIDDSSLDEHWEADICKIQLKDYFKNLGDIMYDGVVVNNEEPSIESEMEKVCKMADIHNNMEQQEETVVIVDDKCSWTSGYEKTEDGSTDWDKVEKNPILEGKTGDDLWTALANM